jgi:FMN phosphatase YigB (HAD superfamily)
MKVKGYLLKLTLFLLLSSASFLTASSSLTVETKRLSDITNYLEDKILVIVDIDNTLIEPSQQLGSDQWAFSRVVELKKSGLSDQVAFSQALAEWRFIHSFTRVQTPEITTAALIHDLQARGYALMGLTTRFPEDAPMTQRELRDVNIDLSRSSVTKDAVDIPLKPPVQFAGGILFVTLLNKKGEALKAFLSEIDFHPKKILFIDDKLSHVKDVEEACLSMGIDYIGIRYGGSDARVAAYDHQMAEIQRLFLYHFLSDDIILSDAQAGAILAPS